MIECGDGTLSDRQIDPYSLVAKSNTWYVVALHKGQFHTFRADRFRRAVLLDEYFERRADFDLATYWREQNTRFEAEAERFTFTLRVAPGCLQFLKLYAVL